MEKFFFDIRKNLVEFDEVLEVCMAVPFLDLTYTSFIFLLLLINMTSALQKIIDFL